MSKVSVPPLKLSQQFDDDFERDKDEVEEDIIDVMEEFKKADMMTQAQFHATAKT